MMFFKTEEKTTRRAGRFSWRTRISAGFTTVSIIGLLGLLPFSGCNNGSKTAATGNAVPIILSISPTSLVVNSSSSSLTINGTGFLSGTVVTVGGQSVTATLVSSTQITAALPSAILSTAGSSQIILSNPAPGGGLSNAVNLVVNNPAPVITTVSPENVPLNSTASTLTINGTGFVSTSVVSIGGATAASTLVSSTQITATIPAAILSQTGSFSVTVTNSTPGGGTSNIASFSVGTVQQNPVPAIAQLSPTYFPVNATTPTLTINGTGFVSGSTVTVGGTLAASTLVNSTQLTVTIPATTLSQNAVVPVIVTNPEPGGGASNTVNVGIGAEQARMADSFVDSIGAMLRVNSSNYSTVLSVLEASGIRHLRAGSLGSSGAASSDATNGPLIAQLISDVKKDKSLDLHFLLVPEGGCPAPLSYLSTMGNLTWIPAANIDGFEGLNEWNGGGCSGSTWDSQVTDFQTALSASVTDNASTLGNAFVAGPSLGYDLNPADLTPAINTLVADNISSSIQVANLHIYSGGGSYPSANMWLAGPAWEGQVYGATKPMVASETGYQTDLAAGGITEQALTKYYSRLYFEFFNNGFSHAFAYELMDDPTQTGGEASYGLAHADGTTKGFTQSNGSPAGTIPTIANEISLLSDPGPSFTPHTLTLNIDTGGNPNIHHTLLQKRNGTYYLVLWQEVSNVQTDPATGQFTDSTPATAYVAIDFGSTTFTTINAISPQGSTNPWWGWSTQSSIPGGASVDDNPVVYELIP